MYNPNEIADVIKKSAQSCGITVKQALADCDINKGFIYDLEHKQVYPRVDKVVRLAEYFRVSVDYLLGRTDNPEVNR